MIRDEISSNKRKSYLLFFFFIILLMLIGFVFGLMFDSILFTILIIGISIVMVIVSYYYSDSIVLKISGARPVDRKTETHLYHLVDGLAIAAGLPKPKCYVIDSKALNAFATGRDPDHGVICVTTGLLKTLNREELEGVIAHEMSHIKNYDIRFMSIVAVLVGITTIISHIMLRSFFWSSGSSRGNKGGSVQIAMLGLGIILAILTPIIATIIKMAISRQREFLADSTGALLTRYPEGLASALEKISKDTTPLKTANKATAHLYISNPLKNQKSFLNNMFSTHPPIEERVKRLRSM